MSRTSLWQTNDARLAVEVKSAILKRSDQARSYCRRFADCGESPR